VEHVSFLGRRDYNWNYYYCVIVGQIGNSDISLSECEKVLKIVQPTSVPEKTLQSRILGSGSLKKRIFVENVTFIPQIAL
jgi:hypothetical protein